MKSMKNDAFSLSLLLPLSFNQHVALQNKIKNAGFVTSLCIMLSIFKPILGIG